MSSIYKSIALIALIAFAPTILLSRNYQETESIINSILSDSITEEKQPGDGTEENDLKKAAEKSDGIGSFSMTGPDEVLLKNGIDFYNSGLYTNALESFNQLLESRPGSNFAPSALLWAGKSEMKLNLLDDAVERFSKIDPQSGEYPGALYYAGLAHTMLRDSINAIESYQKLYSLFPDHDLADNAILNAAQLYSSNKKGSHALQLLVTLIKNYGNRETVDRAYFYLAKVFEQDPELKDLEKTRTLYRLFLTKASNGEPYFATSPLLKRVQSDLQRLEERHFLLR